MERNPTTPEWITKGYFYGHGHVLEVPNDKIEFVEGTHPVVYIGQGSHASYPKAGVAFDWRLLTWIPDLSDIFRRLPDRKYDDIFTGLGLKWNKPATKEVIQINWEPKGGVISDKFSNFSGIYFFSKA